MPHSKSGNVIASVSPYCTRSSPQNHLACGALGGATGLASCRKHGPARRPRVRKRVLSNREVNGAPIRQDEIIHVAALRPIPVARDNNVRRQNARHPDELSVNVVPGDDTTAMRDGDSGGSGRPQHRDIRCKCGFVAGECRDREGCNRSRKDFHRAQTFWDGCDLTTADLLLSSLASSHACRRAPKRK